MLDKTVLPVREPLITSYGLYTNKLSILAAYPETTGWVFSNFIQLQYGKNLLKFYDSILRQSPWTQDYVIPMEVVRDRWDNDITAFLLDCIDRRYYVLVDVDNSFLSNTTYFGKKRFTHEIFVYGYDRQEERFLIAGNLSHGKYVYTTCTFREMDAGFRHYDVLDDHWLDGIMLHKFKPAKIGFDPSRVGMLIGHYLSGTNFLEFDNHRAEPVNAKSYAFGTNVYDALVEGLRSYEGGYHPTLDVRCYHLLFDHKRMMQARMAYMAANGHVRLTDRHAEQFDQLCKDALVARNLVLKHRVTGDRRIVASLTDRLRMLQQNETELLEHVLQSL